MNNTPIGNRIHISIFGKRNTGKSTLINTLTNQEIAVVSDVAGTTTDPVYKTMELLPIGPVVITDTAGLDDEGALGTLRMKKTYEILRRTDLAVIVISAPDGLTEFEMDIVRELKDRNIKAIGVINKCDLADISSKTVKNYSLKLGIPLAKISCKTKEGIEDVKKLIVKNASYDDSELSIVSDLINPGDIVVLVTPIDKAAPKGRLILPQQQTIRDIIDSDAIAVVTKEYELKETFLNLSKKPALVVTDSQAFLKVTADTPPDIPMTSFSILFARQKGDLVRMVRGLKKIESLKDGARVLIVEGCTHHRQSDDIGKVKIPRWIRHDTIVHCGACMLNKREMQYRIREAEMQGVAITNYGLLIAYVLGILRRALGPFPAALLALDEAGMDE